MKRLALWALLALPLSAANPALRIRNFLNTSPVARTSFWGIRIVDLAQNRLIFELNSGRLFLPASNAKLFTTALALNRLGPDYRFTTRVLAPAPPAPDGCVDSIRIVGGSDPNLSGRTIPYVFDSPPGDPLSAIDDLAAQVAAHGVRCVHGAVTGDDTAYVWDPYPDSWNIGDAVWDYGAAVSALSINDNTLTLHITPGASESDPPHIAQMPALAYYRIENHLRTGGRERDITIDRLPGARDLRLWGQLPLQDPGDDEALGIDDPALYAALAFKDSLARHGIAVAGEAGALHLYPYAVPDLKNGPSAGPLPGVELARRDSAPLLEDLRITDKVSQNMHAEMALLAVARERRGVGSREAGLAEMQAFLDEAHIDRAAYTFADGSGLSRMDMVSPSAVVQLLAYEYRSPQRDAWLSLLPVAAGDGTLQARFTKTRGAGRIWAKTGSLSHVSTLSGYARRGGSMLAFSILVNNSNAPPADIRAAIDHICLLMLQ